MPYQVDVPISISYNGNSTNYLFYSKHRGTPTDEISVWVVDFDTELSCFDICYKKGWHNGAYGWGLISAGVNQLLRLGENLRNDQLIIAKFVTDQNQWHGYPADLRHKPADKPLPNILLKWFSERLISKAIMSRIKQGQI